MIKLESLQAAQVSIKKCLDHLLDTNGAANAVESIVLLDIVTKAAAVRDGIERLESAMKEAA